jgi:hypothetical protein
MDKIQESGFAASKDIPKYQRLMSLLGQVETGKFKGTTTDIKSAMKGMGVDLEAMGISDDVAPAQAARAATRELALQLRNPAGGAGMPGAMSDQDRIYLESMIAGIESDPKAWPQMLDAAIQLRKRDMDVAKLARKYASEHNGQLDYGFLDELEKFSEANPLFKSKPIVKEPKATKSKPPWEE